ncbi:MAG: hypothetical protein RBS72_08715 [Sedimentisphaerales bacterium]|jgi:hypothetical protein|nr:hypothetical protein [Sedimentisphaerales bacterium]HNY77684.1 hypothetical protein [Sedimentisphaerales bacterium]HOC63428.1 hypothetical protein [Sedimentisphaerales bacterium]HOH63859.1 hypothetical protein [Sedimentisphaerales bacterium]HPY48438.1 hypothetical protein [Sedimentisphaerales bacterium]
MERNGESEMNVRVEFLQKTECYACTRRQAKTAFGNLGLKWIGLGYPSRHFLGFDRRTQPRPCLIERSVVCEAAYSPQREGWFSAYAMRKEIYPPEAREEFRDRVLPEMRRWLQKQAAKPDTAILGYEYLLAEWDGATHRFHTFTWR